MNQHEHDDLIRNYLLGALPEAETKRFEERYLEDESLFAELQEIEDELIDDYASGALTAEQRALFEKYFLDSSERREKVELARAMTTRAIAWKQEQEAKQSATTVIGSAATTNADETTSSKVLRFKSQVRVPSWFPWAAMAASVLFAVGAGALWFNNRELRRQLIAQQTDVEQARQQVAAKSQRAAEVQTQLEEKEKENRSLSDDLLDLVARPQADELFRIALSRYYQSKGSKGEGERKTKSLTIPATAKNVQLSVAFAKTEFASFQALLRHADQTPAGGPRVGLKAKSVGEDQIVTFKLPTEKLSAGDYELIISGVTPDGQTEGVGRYYLHVVRR